MLKRYIQNNITVSGDQLEHIARSFKPKSVKRNTILLTAGDVCREFYFVDKGCIRTYYISQEGRERTRYFAFDGVVGTALSSFIDQKPSFEFVDVLEDSELLCISHHHFTNWLTKYSPGLIFTVNCWNLLTAIRIKGLRTW